MLKSNKAIPTSLGLIFIFVISIVWINYSSQMKLREASLKHISEFSKREADSFSHFFSERKNDLLEISSSNELLNYFENKAMGMSGAGGTQANIIQISKLFKRREEIKQIESIPLYSRIAFVTESGKILADNNGPVFKDESCLIKIPENLQPGEVRILFKSKDGEKHFILVTPYIFRNKQIGTIMACLNSKAVMPFMSLAEPKNFHGLIYLIHDRQIFSPLYDVPHAISQKIAEGWPPQSNKIYKLSLQLSDEEGKTNNLIIRSQIKGTPFYLLTVTLEKELLGAVSPLNLLIFILLLALLLLGGGLFVIRTNSRNLDLNIMVDESAKQAQKIKLQNNQLINEIEARSRAEKALMQINDELETRVQQRTTDLKERTEALTREVQVRHKAEEAMRMIFNNTHDSIFIHDTKGRIQDVNDTMLETYQVDMRSAIQMSFKDDFSAPSMDLDILDTQWQLTTGGKEVVFDWTTRRPGDGREFDVEVALNRIELDGKIVILANVHDISEQKKILIQQAEHQEFLGTIFEGIGAAVFVFDPTKGLMVDCNCVGEKLLGLSRNAILDGTCQSKFTFTSNREKDLLCPNWHEQGSYEEGLLTMQDGSTLPVSRHLFEIHIGGMTHLVQVVFDITERKHLERKLSIAQKLESIGLLASGIAHEINTPIQYVGDSIRFVKEAYSDITELIEIYEKYINEKSADGRKEILEEIEEHKEDIDLEFIGAESIKACDRALEGVKRVATIVLAMKNFSHSGEEKAKAVDINKAIKNTIEVSRNEWKYAADLETDLEPELPYVYCLPGAINQVLLNVIVNAAHAIAEHTHKNEKGTISVSTQLEPPFAKIIIKDTGCGISKENMNKIFDPFFTTKEVGKGTGQGLAIVHDIIIEKHGGTIDIESEEGQGTTFIIKLPIGGNSKTDS
ncbi:ATP-binding protein [Maridesulfovibrio sp.]|uniref:PAS domain-containing sensor histidine kinase n=1 Tax=Maridesulfovibrio sp. TaxID=2795000 RepID=UPI0039EF920C